jgi:hypothetical protein
VNNQGEPLMVGDYDGDGNADIAFGDYVNYTTATVLYGDSTGHFVPTYVTATEKVVFSNGDVNSDGKTDLLGRANTLAQHVDVFYGNTARSFASRTTIALAHCVTQSPTVADMDGNGLNDLITVETGCSNTSGFSAPYYVGLRTRNANSSYNTEQTLYTLSNPQYGGIQYGPAVLRLNRDAKPDLAFGICSDPECLGTTMTLALNTTAGSFPACAPPNSFGVISLCSPGATAPGTTVAFHIGAAGQVAMRKVEVWVDGSKKVEQLDGFSHYSFPGQEPQPDAGEPQGDDLRVRGGQLAGAEDVYVERAVGIEQEGGRRPAVADVLACFCYVDVPHLRNEMGEFPSFRVGDDCDS